MGIMHILRGEGIECENETLRALRFFGFVAEFWDLPKLLNEPSGYLEKLHANDWIFIPGGFSFADHLGSGRLLAFELNSISFFERAVEREASLWGICNGFQVLAASGVFGSVKLEHNQRSAKPTNFEDRWITLRAPELDLTLQCPARHGEGRLVIDELAPGTEPFLFYDDPVFENGSDKKIAGLKRRMGTSQIIGMMPHPEIYLRPEQHPDFSASDSKLEISELKKQSIFRLLEAK